MRCVNARREKTTALGHHSVLSWKKLKLRQRTILIHSFPIGESGKSDGNVRGGIILPGLIIFITLSSRSGQMRIESDMFLPSCIILFPLSLFSLILHHPLSVPSNTKLLFLFVLFQKVDPEILWAH